MVIAVLVGWVLGGLLLALVVAGAVRVADARSARRWVADAEPDATPGDLSAAA